MDYLPFWNQINGIRLNVLRNLQPYPKLYEETRSLMCQVMNVMYI